MKRINLVFAVHNHQPIGNFDSVFEEAYQHSYKPFLEILARHPSIKFSQHWTGPLLEWVIQNHPGLIELMRKLVKRGQLELLTGAYYEAVLSIIPEVDRVGQIRKLTDFIIETFGVEPRGMWLAERVWEQTLVRSIVDAGVEFVVVDDTHFKHAGLHDDELTGYFVTEDQGTTLKVIPIDRVLRYTIPFRSVEESLRRLRNAATEDSKRVILHADDGEKFGVWPRTYTHVYEHGWLESFCSMLDKEKEWIHTIHMATMADSFSSRGRVYLPNASYSEMMKWALSAHAFLKLESFEQALKDSELFDENGMFVSGGFWRNFLAKYPEANHMHKKMLRVARRVHEAHLDDERAASILDHLWAGQCNDPYWHGVFGGLYLPNLRFPVYRNLLQAEIALEKTKKLPAIRIEETDFDCDGTNEILIESNELNLYLKPSTGGHLVELDFKPRAFNLLDILSRHEEAYHRRLTNPRANEAHQTGDREELIVKEEGLEQHLNYDWYRHASLVDHFIGPETTLEGFSRCRYWEMGDFVDQPYQSEVKKKKSGVEASLWRDGAIWRGNVPHRISLKKIVRYQQGTTEFNVEYSLRNSGDHPVDIWFGVELCVGLMAGDAHDRYYIIDEKKPRDSRLRSIGQDFGVSRWGLVDEWLGLRTDFETTLPAELWRFPIETVSLSEAGFERVFQCSVLMPLWRFSLDREFSFTLTQRLTTL